MVFKIYHTNYSHRDTHRALGLICNAQEPQAPCLKHHGRFQVLSMHLLFGAISFPEGDLVCPAQRAEQNTDLLSRHATA